MGRSLTRWDMLTTRLTACLSLAYLAYACASDVPVDVQPSAGASGTGGTSPDIFIDEPAAGTAGSGGAQAAGGAPVCGAPAEDASCGGDTFAGKTVPLDIYIMFDQSGSMCACLDAGAGQLCLESGCNTTRLDAVRDAIEQFTVDPANAGVGVGLGLFGQLEIGSTSCDAEAYGTPAVAMGSLPDQAEPLSEAMNLLEPTGETPTGPALRGACDYARDYRTTVPDHQVVLLLLTDGRPEAPTTCRGGDGSCCPSLDDAVVAAQECRASTGIRTFVLGIGPLLDNLEQIAVAGGTGEAYLVQGGDVGAEVRNALNRIRGNAAIPCELQLPEPPSGQALDLAKINLSYEAGDCTDTAFSAVRSAADCGDADGWYYDDPDAPARILLCPNSCDRVSGPGGNLYYSVGCDTRFIVR